MNSLQYSLLISVSAHALILWWLMFTVPVKINQISQISIAALSPQPDVVKSPGTSSIRQSRQPVDRSRTEAGRKPFAGSRNTGAAAESLEAGPPQSAEPAPGGGVTSSGTGETSLVEGEARDQPGDVAVGSKSAVSSSGGLTAEAKETPSGRGELSLGSGGSSSAPRKSSTASEMDSFSGAEIPGYVIDAAGHRPRDAGAIYPEVDKYVLYGSDKQTAINVPGTEVCFDGEFIRSKEATTIAEIKTDYSKCRYLDFGDDSLPAVKCPPEAHAKIIHHNSYLSSPLTYNVRTCLEYDASHCYLTTNEETEREICRIDFQYEGLWAEGTKFFYRCARSETRTYRQSLQYNIRWFMEIEIDERLRRREILRETRAVSRCG